MKRLFRKLKRTSATATPIYDARQAFAPGHFYSPIPSISSVLKREHRTFGIPAELPGIDLNATGQLKVVSDLASVCDRQPFLPTSNSLTRFQLPNDNFGGGEAVIYFGLLGLLRPRRIIEVGSGFSTLVLLDALSALGVAETECTCIEPYPDLLRSLLWKDDENRLRIVEQELQDIDVGTFGALQENDILFIDSTHVSKIGSDVNYIFSEILPRLTSGVYVHFHDIYYPFEYPKQWLLQGRAWNEAYVLRAFLQFNRAFEIFFFNSFLFELHRGALEPLLQAFAPQAGSSIWLRRRE